LMHSSHICSFSPVKRKALWKYRWTDFGSDVNFSSFHSHGARSRTADVSLLLLAVLDWFGSGSSSPSGVNPII
jgi:hypothetical protein